MENGSSERPGGLNDPGEGRGRLPVTAHTGARRAACLQALEPTARPAWPGTDPGGTGGKRADQDGSEARQLMFERWQEFVEQHAAVQQSNEKNQKGRKGRKQTEQTERGGAAGKRPEQPPH